jgi:hypothetical protein
LLEGRELAASRPSRDGGGRSAKRTADSRLRDRDATPAQELADRLRAGQLSAERVALAAYLGHPSAGLVTSPWEPPQELNTWPAQVVVTLAPLSLPQRVWLACLCAEHALAVALPDRREPIAALASARRWCRGEVEAEEVVASLPPHLQRAADGPHGRAAASAAARAAFCAAESPREGAGHGALALHHAVEAARARHRHHNSERPEWLPLELAEEAEQAWQAAAMAESLLSGELDGLRVD